jgi:hypothetical protein
MQQALGLTVWQGSWGWRFVELAGSVPVFAVGLDCGVLVAGGRWDNLHMYPSTLLVRGRPNKGGITFGGCWIRRRSSEDRALRLVRIVCLGRRLTHCRIRDSLRT